MLITKIIALIAAAVVDMVVATLLWLGIYILPVFLVSIVFNLLAGVTIGWSY